MILFTALIGPHFVDWTSYRETFEREATGYVGRPVSVAGKASVRILPTPVVSFTDINVGDPAAPDMTIERFSAEIELAPLLKGQVRVIQMTIEHPVFHVDVAALVGGKLPAGSWRLDPERISLERLEVDNGSAVIADSRSGRAWQAEGIDAVVEADTLMGPGKLNATFALDGKPVELGVGLGRLTDNDHLAVKVSLRSPDYPVTLSTDGTFHFAGSDPPKYEGTATVVGVAPPDPATPRSPWADFRASGGFELVPTAISVEKMQLAYGAMERPLILEAAGRLDFAEAARFELSLAARQIDIDRTLGGGAEQPIAIEAAVPELLGMLPQLPMPPIPGELHFDAQGVVVGGGVIQGVAADLATGDNAWTVDDFAATLPGETQVDVKGTLGVRPAATFRGHASVESRRPTVFAEWWRGQSGSAARIGRFSLDADLDLRPDDLRLANLSAKTGAGTTTGSIDMQRFPQSGRYFVTVDLKAARADLVQSRALAELLAGKTSAAGKIEQMTVSLEADVLTAGGAEAHSVRIEGGLEGGQFNLRHLSVADLEGASIEASGSIRDPFGAKRSGNVEASIRADDFKGAADFLASFAPESRIASHLRDVAPILSPVLAEISASGGSGDEKLRLALNGSFGATHLKLKAEGDGSLADLASLSGTLNLHADGEDSATVLRQLGLAALPVHSSPLTLDADFNGAVAAGGKLKLNGTVAGVDMSYEAATALKNGEPTLSGGFKLKSVDIDPVLLLAGIAVPGVGEGHEASATGKLGYSRGTLDVALDKGSFDGGAVSGALSATLGAEPKISGALKLATVSAPALIGFAVATNPGIGDEGWSDAPFAAALPGKLALDLTIDAEKLDLGAPVEASNAKLAFQLAGGKLQLDLNQATFAGGALKGALSATLNDGEADVSLRGGLTGAALEELVWQGSDLPVASGTLDVSVDTAARGRSTAGVVATLSGSGSFAVSDAKIVGLNPEALTAVMAEAAGEKEPDEGKAREDFAKLFGSSALDIGKAAGSFTLSNGILNISTVSLEAGPTSILADATFDLNRLTVASQWVERSGGEGAEETQPYVQVRFSGDIDDPDRQVNLDPLLNLMRSRFLQRQLAELEALEAERKRIEAERKAEEERRAEIEREAAAARQADDERRMDEAPAEPPATGATAPLAVEPRARKPAPVAPPIELVPPAPAPAEPPPGTPPVRLPQYRMLPNGTIIKVR